MELSGYVEAILPKKDWTKGDKSGSTQDIVIKESTGQYTQSCVVNFFKIELLNNIGLNDEVTVKFNLKANEYNGKYYNQLSGYSIEKKSMPKASYNPPTQINIVDGEVELDLPF